MIQGFKNACRTVLRVHTQVQSKYSSSTANSPNTSRKAEWIRRRNILFTNEKERLKEEIGRIEKIAVKLIPTDQEGIPIEMYMNKNISTPNDCALHLTEGIHQTAALALVDGVPYDMHRPLTNDCELKLLTMQMPKDHQALNPAFWRTCSFILGAMIDSSFKDEITMYLHSFPRPNIKSGSFVYDIVLDLPEWQPTKAELRAMSAQYVKFTSANRPIERLQVSEQLALEMFQDNPFKSKQIPDIAATNEGMITLYRINDNIDISKGPMVGHSGIIGRVTVTAVHKLESEETDRLYRFQGVALPLGVHLNHYAYSLLEEKARKLNYSAWMPVQQKAQDVVEEDESGNRRIAKN